MRGGESERRTTLPRRKSGMDLERSPGVSLAIRCAFFFFFFCAFGCVLVRLFVCLFACS